MSNYRKYFSNFLKKNEGIGHFACHSHHYWPDCTKDAQLDYWEDSCDLVDNKWEKIFSKKVPNVQKLLSEVLDFDRPSDIAFAPNTHELVYRILSSYQKKISLLTTDSEFYSFSRQLKRLVELDMIEVKIVPTFPFHNFEERFLDESKNNYDIIFLSQVFFNSGLCLENFEQYILTLLTTNSQIIVDGYHGFMAVPTNLSKIGDKIFYLAGSYKYAGAGEGCCFTTIPKDCSFTPRNTGWFADLENLDNLELEKVSYPDNGLRFAGSTMDFSALYRLESVLELYKKESVTVSNIHDHVIECQNRFIESMKKEDHSLLNSKNLILRNINCHGHFLTFDLPDSETVIALKKKLESKGVETDSRKNRLRFGFSIYTDLNYEFSKIFKD
ncbi:aminotransferase class V-fold PLP-dependent enzyme [Halobacteriovorax sp. HLS]|uniref:aminotransferase class V-fold PLP-dependent enzyme n=1 Tax=Halobacteriovorax sp. HLS TaxID=2234000 RepID=UPI000FDC1828|nr:aminotransferase class V-fold PLP-dependent enzyme [Halobacteriovorax sp. HLS]